MLRTILAAFVVLSAASSASAQSFDLICKGHMTKFVDNEQVQSEPFNLRFRLDLTSRKWCRDACDNIVALPRFDDGTIYLVDGKVISEGTIAIKGTTWVNRITGEFFESVSSVSGLGNIVVSRRGTCEPAPFTPFPPAKF